jgi:hypothetical protein
MVQHVHERLRDTSFPYDNAGNSDAKAELIIDPTRRTSLPIWKYSNYLSGVQRSSSKVE